MEKQEANVMSQRTEEDWAYATKNKKKGRNNTKEWTLVGHILRVTDKR